MTLHLPTKPALRQSFLERRLQMLPNERIAAAEAICAAFLRHVEPVAGAVVAGYWPVKGEVDALPILRALLSREHACALPHVAGDGAPLLFRRWDENVKMTTGKYGLQEPAAGDEAVMPDVLLVPVLAFDANGYRLGYGGGFYDRTIARLKKQKPVRAIGLAYEMQHYKDGLPRDGNDIRMDAVITEGNIYK
ncbi:MAG: 5-formyltetrahydrofolate cyclo-ligase [Alphaproteobacteria bacterium]|nr:5-formyltetrahydrofolate cyclo-ligase [Alphaproteobacteria bacterium]MDE2337033.1 5-formyltetrahydrofolate cyclo-ligase [Alphaproteobacteria bacterium]